MNDFFHQIFFELLGINLPALIALIVGMAVTLWQWRRHPPAARWAMLGFCWMFATYLMAILWHSYLSHMILGVPRAFGEETPYLFGLSCCEATAYFFFLMALNAARKPYRPPFFLEDFDDDDEFRRP